MTEAQATGAVAIALKLTETSEVASVTYNVSGNGITPLTGTVDLAASSPELLIEGVPVGNGLLVELSAVSTDSMSHCSGSVMVDVVAGTTVTASVLLQCRDAASYSTGGVLVDGRFDTCPYFKSYSIAPLTTSIAPDPGATAGAGGAGGASGSTGGIITLNVQAGDEDGDTLTFTVTQNPQIGTLSTKAGSLPKSLTGTFTCRTTGTTTLTIGVTDGDCAAVPQNIPVNCVDPLAPIGTGGSGGDGSGGAGSEVAGSGGGAGSAGGAGTGLAGAAGGTAGAAGTAAAAGGNGGAAGAGGGNGGAAAAAGGNAGAGGATASTCGDTPPSECVSAECAQCGAMDDHVREVSGCTMDLLPDAADRALCESAYACFTNPANDCTNQGDPLKCWCGTNPTTCLTDNAPPTQANGPCLQEVFAAGKTMDAATIRLRFTDPAYPLGAAVNLVVDRGGFCSAECGIK